MTRSPVSATRVAEPTTAAIETIRRAFPALEREVGGQPIAYFDGPGGTQVPAVVADAVRAYLIEHNANAGWSYPTSLETDAVLDEGRAAYADFFGGRADEIAFGQNMTTLTLRVSRALGRTLRPGDPVVVTELDHHANVDPWRALAVERGAEIRTVRMDPGTGTVDMQDLERKVDGARILAIGAASNALGTMPDVASAARLASAAGAVVFVDAVHYAPHALPDVAAWGADFAVVSPYKFYGPHLGVLWGRRERIEALELPRVASAPDDSPARLETGTLSFEAIAGATAAVEFLAGLAGPARTEGDRRDRLATAYASLHERGERLFHRLWTGIREAGARTHGPPPGEPRTPTLGFAVEGADPSRATADLARQGVFITHGDFYATTVVRRLGYGDGGMLRAGCVAYTTEAEVDRLVEGVRALR
jgi:cysteine desulfurase family protein (TIGR01976 family)